MTELNLQAAQTFGVSTASMLFNNLCSVQELCIFVHKHTVVVSSNTVEKPNIFAPPDAQSTDMISSMNGHVLTAAGRAIIGLTNPKGFAMIDASDGSPSLFVPSDGQQYRCYAIVNSVGLVSQQTPCTVLLGTDHGDVIAVVLNSELVAVHTVNHAGAHGSESVTCLTGGEIDDTLTVAVSGDGSGSLSFWKLNDMGLPIKGSSHKSINDCVTSVQMLLGAQMPADAAGMIGASYSSGAIKLFNRTTNELKVEISAHSRPITALTYNGFNNCLASAGEDQLLCVWKMPDNKEGQVRLVAHKHHPNFLLTGCAFSSDGGMLHANAFESDVVWSYETKKAI